MISPVRVLLVGSAFALSACSLFRGDDERIEPMPAPAGWRDVATAADRERLRTWRDAWTEALQKVRASGQGDKLAIQGPLMQPDAALASVTPPPGDYSCRTFKLGAQQERGGLDYVAYAPFMCRIAVEKALFSFTKLSGSQRPVGLLFPDRENRMIFLGTMMLGDETRPLDYDRDPERDIAGAFERIGPERWRLVLPWPHWESTLDIIELVPKG